MIRILFILFFVSSNYISISLIQDSNGYFYDESLGLCLRWDKRKLINDDFKEKNNIEKKEYKAETFFTFNYANVKYSKDTNLVAVIYTIFLVDDSWKSDSVMSTILLNHEQRHLDIAEINCRLFKNDLRKLSITTNNEFTTIYNKKIDYYISKAKTMNDQYDSETKHGILLDKQKKWDKKIDDLLKKYEAYANDTVVVKRIRK